MSFLVTARKYRPSTFAEVVAQGHVSNTLLNSIRLGRTAHAYLFSGPRGVGKTTTARIFAKALNCPNAVNGEPCNTCDTCVEITEGRCMDVIEIDGASNNGVEQVRTIRDSVRYTPSRDKYKMYIIDEVHMLSKGAFNALLKTLEEPPSHLILIMTAQNSYDLLPTIRSRAVQFQLTPLNEEEMRAFVQARRLPDPERRMALASGSPGMAVVLDLEAYDRRRGAMLKLLEVGAGQAAFAEWMKHSEYISARKTEKLEYYLDVLYLLLEDVLVLQQGGAKVRNPDIQGALTNIAGRVSFEWIRAAVKRVDELAELLRRNIQKGIALDAFALELRSVS
jgi:DNA polymerase III delta' subunit